MSELLDRWITSTAWTMEAPVAYSAFHILFTLGGFALCTLAAWKLRKVNDKVFRGILFTLGLLLAISEVYKQLFYFYAVEDNAYAWGDFPFQLCSIPMYLCLIAPLLKPGKVQKQMYTFMVLFNLLGGAIAFTEPSGLFHGYWFLTCHALAWHMFLVFIGLFICFSGRAGYEKKDYWGAVKLFVILCAIAFLINWGAQSFFDAKINMFFVGPGDSTIVVFKQISQWFGWYVSTAIYIPAVCLGAFLIFLPIHHIAKKKSFVAAA